MKTPPAISHSSSALEKVLEHRLVAELASALWQAGIPDFEILRAEVDAHGYDLVIEAAGIMRHIQLKAMVQGGRRRDVGVNLRLAAKPSGCVVWMIYDPATLSLGPFRWFGGEPGEQLPTLGDRVVRHSKGNADGVKLERAGHRLVPRSRFITLNGIEALADALFGIARRTSQVKGPLMTERWIAKTAFPIGIDLSQPPPEMRYQLLDGRMYTLQLFPSGAIARGEIDPVVAGFPLDDGEGWYDGDGSFLGEDPQLPSGSDP